MTEIERLEQIERETGDWLDTHGYNPTVAHLRLDAMSLHNKLLTAPLVRSLVGLLEKN